MRNKFEPCTLAYEESQHSWGLLRHLNRDQIDKISSYPYGYFKAAYYWKENRRFGRCHLINYDSVIERMEKIKTGVGRRKSLAIASDVVTSHDYEVP